MLLEVKYLVWPKKWAFKGFIIVYYTLKSIQVLKNSNLEKKNVICTGWKGEGEGGQKSTKKVLGIIWITP